VKEGNLTRANRLKRETRQPILKTVPSTNSIIASPAICGKFFALLMSMLMTPNYLKQASLRMGLAVLRRPQAATATYVQRTESQRRDSHARRAIGAFEIRA
jgi:hypothetical protein